MLDPQLFRADIEAVRVQLQRRGIDFNTQAYTDLEERRKSVQVKTQELQNKRNLLSKSIGQAAAKGEDTKPLLDEVQGLKNSLKIIAEP